MPLVTANGVELHHEIRGSGPPVLFIGGLDGGTFDGLASCIERGGFTTIVYDRRGHSRSPRPPSWNATSIREQAADAAALIDVLGIAPAAVIGNSIGALIALELLLNDRQRVRSAVLLDTAPLESAIGELAQQRPAAPAGGGLRESFEGFLRFVGAWDALDPASRERLMGNAGVFFGIDLPARAAYRPDEARLAANDAPVLVAVGEQSPPPPRAMASWLAQRLGAEVTTTPGGHVGYLSRPDEVAQVVLRFLIRNTNRE